MYPIQWFKHKRRLGGEEVGMIAPKSYRWQIWSAFKLRQGRQYGFWNFLHKDKLDNSVGEMKIRGIVLGDTFSLKNMKS